MRRKEGAKLAEDPAPPECPPSPDVLDMFSGFFGKINPFQRSQEEIDRSISRALQPAEPVPESPKAPSVVEKAWRAITGIFESDSDDGEQTDESRRLRRLEREQRRQATESSALVVSQQKDAQDFLSEEFDEFEDGHQDDGLEVEPAAAVPSQKEAEAEAARLKAEKLVKDLSESSEVIAKIARAKAKAEEAAIASVEVQAAEEAKVLIATAKEAAAVALALELEQQLERTEPNQMDDGPSEAFTQSAKDAQAKLAAAASLQEALDAYPQEQKRKDVPLLNLASGDYKSQADQIQVLFESLVGKSALVLPDQLLFLMQTLDPVLTELEVDEALQEIGCTNAGGKSLDREMFGKWVEFLFSGEEEDEFEETFEILLDAALVYSMDHATEGITE